MQVLLLSLSNTQPDTTLSLYAQATKTDILKKPHTSLSYSLVGSVVVVALAVELVVTVVLTVVIPTFVEVTVALPLVLNDARVSVVVPLLLAPDVKTLAVVDRFLVTSLTVTCAELVTATVPPLVLLVV